MCLRKRERRISMAPRVRLIQAGVATAVLLSGAAGGILYKKEYPYPYERVSWSERQGEWVTYEMRIPFWEGLEVYDKYSDISLDGVEYCAGKGIVPAERLGRKLGDVTAEGVDYQADAAGGEGRRFLDAELYEIKGIEPGCAVAVRYQGTDMFYSALNTDYRPGTLGEFLEDLDLENTLSFDKAFYEYHRRSGEYASVVFEDVDSGSVWEMLLAGGSAPNVYNDLSHEHERALEISVSSSLFGFENADISVYQDGYVMTNVFATGKQFFVGEENTRQFINYVLKECEGFETIYRMEEEAVPETGDMESGVSPSYSPRK